MTDLALIVAVTALIGNVLSFIRFGSFARDKAIEEGRRHETMEQLRRDLVAAHDKIRILEKGHGEMEGDIIEIKSDLKHIIKAIERLEKKLDEHLVSHGGGK
jgi:hypothetical protein